MRGRTSPPPRDQLARDAGVEVAERGGVVVDAQLRTTDPSISAIGEVAAVAHPDGSHRCHGLVAPGYDMARTIAAELGASAPPTGCRGPRPPLHRWER